MDYGVLKIMNHKCLLIASGTSGHILPTIEVAKKLLTDGYDVFWIGYGYDQEFIDHSKFFHINVQTKSPRNFSRLLSKKFYLNLFSDIFKINNILKNNKFDFIICAGGFVCLIPAMLAFIKRNNIFIYEQNVILGLTNKFISFFAKDYFYGLPPINNDEASHYVGQPLRQDIVNLFLNKREKQLLILGGSLGASFFNKDLVRIFKGIHDLINFKIIHIAGLNHDLIEVIEEYKKIGLSPTVYSYFPEIYKLYESSTHVISRAGAMTIAELNYLELQTLLIPIPHSAGNHQLKNAKTFEKYQNFSCVEQADLSKDDIINFISKPCHNSNNSIRNKNPEQEIINRCLNHVN